MMRTILLQGLAAATLLFTIGCGTGGIRMDESRTSRPKVERPAPPPKTVIPSTVKPQMLFGQGMKFYQAKEYNKAYDYFSESAKYIAGTPKEFDAKVMALRSLVRAGRPFEVEEESAKILTLPSIRDDFYVEIIEARFEALQTIGEMDGAVNLCETGLANPKLTKIQESLRQRCRDLIETKLVPTELAKVSDSSPIPEFRSIAAYRLGELALEARDQSAARSYFARAANASDSDWSLRAREMVEQLEAVRRVSPKTVGAVLPLTGKHAAVSQKILRGLQVGLGLYGNVPSSFKLAVIDSEGNPDNARRGVERLVREDNVIAVVGSVLSKNAPAVAAKANELGVPSLALSQKSGITEAGNTVFRNALTSEMQVRYLVKTAMEDMGMKKFAIMYPNDPYGVEFANIFWDEVLARGGKVTAAQTYGAAETDFRYPVQRLVGTYYIEARKDEYDLRYKEWLKGLKSKTARTTPPEDLLPPVTDFDAIFIPDSVKAMGQISAMLSFNGVKNVKLLGTNLWNVKGLAKRAGLFADNLLFVDSFVATDPSYQRSGFVREYRSVFNEEPGIFEIQGYDAALLLRQLVSQGATSRESLTSELRDLQNFPGALGPMSMSSDREIMRPLVALTLDKGNVVRFTPPAPKP